MFDKASYVKKFQLFLYLYFTVLRCFNLLEILRLCHHMGSFIQQYFLMHSNFKIMGDILIICETKFFAACNLDTLRKPEG